MKNFMLFTGLMSLWIGNLYAQESVSTKISLDDRYQIKTISTSLASTANDPSFLRIVDGEIVNNQVAISKFESIQRPSLNELQELGLNFDRPVLIVQTEKSKVEDEILKSLFADQKFIKEFPFPLNTRLPIAINGKLLSHNNKNEILANVDRAKITEIKYLKAKNNKLSRNLTPFGIINVELVR